MSISFALADRGMAKTRTPRVGNGPDPRGRKSNRHRPPRPLAEDAAPRPAADPVLLAAIFLGALALRVAVLLRLMELPIHRTPQLDSLEFLQRAQSFAQGDFARIAAPQHGPGYPLFMALVFRAFPGSLLALGLVQCVLGSALCVLAATLGRRWFGPRVGIAAGVLLAVYGPLLLLTSLILAEGLLLFLLTLALVVFDPSSRHWLRTAAAGTVVGLAATVRPTALLLLALFVLAALRRGKSRDWAAAGVLIASFLVGLSPALEINARSGRPLILIQGHAGLNFYIGNSPAGTGSASSRLGGSWDALSAEASRQGIRAASAQDRFYFDKTLAEIRANPAGYLRLLGRKTLSLFEAAEIRDSHAFDFFAREIALLRLAPGFGVLVALAACGLFATVRSRQAPLLALGYLLLFAASCVLLVVGFRYRSPIVPVLGVFAGAGAVTLYDALRRRNFRIAAGLGTLAALVGALSHAIRPPDDRRLAEEWSWTGSSLLKEGNLPAAESAYRAALSENPRFAPAWAGLGALDLQRSALSEATRDLERAVSEEPGYARARSLLGSALEKQGRIPEAIEQLEAARRIHPNDPETLGTLVRLLAAAGRSADAEATARSFVERNPGEAVGHRELARVLSSRHRIPEALAEVAKSIALDPGDADAWLLRALLEIEAGNADGAETALRQAEALSGADQPGVRYVRALLERLQGRAGPGRQP